MRLVFFVCVLAAVVALLWLALPRFAASIARAPGNQAVDLASVGADIGYRSYERVVAALNRSLLFIDQRRTHVDLAIAHHNIGQQSEIDPFRRASANQAAVDTMRQSIPFSPVEPAGWLLAAQSLAELGDLEGAARALDWSLLTGPYLHHLAWPRTLLGFRLWERLEEETRDRLMGSIVATLEDEPAMVVVAATEARVEADIESRLRQRENLDEIPLARFVIAQLRLRYADSASPAESLEPIDMRRLLAASTILMTASLPTFADAMTVEQYLAITRDEVPGQPPESVLPYLTGALDGLLMLGTIDARDGTPIFCMPPQEAVDIDLATFKLSLDAMLAEFQQEQPDFQELARSRSIGLAALQLLVVMYPCEAASGD